MQRIGLPENLKASCKLFLAGDVSGTTAYDISGSGNNGTLVNSPTTQRTQGYKGFVFNGSTSYISAGDINVGTGAITACAWIYRTGTVSDYSGVISKGTGVNSSNEFSLQFGGTGTSGVNKIAFEIGDGTATTTFLQDTLITINTNTWYFVCGVFDPGVSQKIYINGAQVATTSSTKSAMLNSTSPVEIGRQYQIAGRNMNGVIQNSLVIQKALTPTEIQQLYYSLYI